MEVALNNPVRTKLLDAALSVIRTKGYAGTTVDDICKAAGVTKGSFFHYYASKEDLAIAATDHFMAMANGLFGSAPFRLLDDPLDRLMGYIDLRASILGGPIWQFTCLLGTLVQETYETHPRIREACDRCISSHAHDVMADIVAAKAKYVPNADWSPEGVAFFTQATLQGSFILAKARNGPAIAVECVRHLRRYIEMLFNRDR
ncbi:MAG: TetR/AcrR family transcriptional regulator [Tepidisphaeraceae bacterium]